MKHGKLLQGSIFIFLFKINHFSYSFNFFHIIYFSSRDEVVKLMQRLRGDEQIRARLDGIVDEDSSSNSVNNEKDITIKSEVFLKQEDESNENIKNETVPPITEVKKEENTLKEEVKDEKENIILKIQNGKSIQTPTKTSAKPKEKEESDVEDEEMDEEEEECEEEEEIESDMSEIGEESDSESLKTKLSSKKDVSSISSIINLIIKF